MQAIFQLGSSIVVDPTTRKVTHIDGVEVPPEAHTDEMQKFADQAIADGQEAAAEIAPFPEVAGDS